MALILVFFTWFNCLWCSDFNPFAFSWWPRTCFNDFFDYHTSVLIGHCLLHLILIYFFYYFCSGSSKCEYLYLFKMWMKSKYVTLMKRRTILSMKKTMKTKKNIWKWKRRKNGRRVYMLIHEYKNDIGKEMWTYSSVDRAMNFENRKIKILVSLFQKITIYSRLLNRAHGQCHMLWGFDK